VLEHLLLTSFEFQRFRDNLATYLVERTLASPVSHANSTLQSSSGGVKPSMQLGLYAGVITLNDARTGRETFGDPPLFPRLCRYHQWSEHALKASQSGATFIPKIERG
jgi:hypothetical protein